MCHILEGNAPQPVGAAHRNTTAPKDRDWLSRFSGPLGRKQAFQERLRFRTCERILSFQGGGELRHEKRFLGSPFERSKSFSFSKRRRE
jgi:hypothetical protein